MVKQAVILGVIVGALIVGGVLEVRVHVDELRHVPGRVMTFVRNPEVAAHVRGTAVALKRWAEQALARDAEKKLELALLYVTQDTERLHALQEDEKTIPAAIAVQAEQLTRSLAGAEESLRAVSVDTVLNVQERSQAAAANIQEVLQRLEAVRDAQAEAQEQFAETVNNLQEKFAAFTAVVGSGAPNATVAGAKDDQRAEPAASPTIPLDF